MILVAIPYHTTKRYAIDHVLDWIDKQTHKDVQIVMRWHTGPYGEDDAVKTQFEFFRNLALETNATHLYILEVDTLPPLDVLDRLLDRKKDIVGALYHYRDNSAPVVAWPKENITTGLCEVDGMGTGAVLLSRRVLTEFSWLNFRGNDADHPLYDLLRSKGYKVYLDTECVCKHYADKESWF